MEMNKLAAEFLQAADNNADQGEDAQILAAEQSSLITMQMDKQNNSNLKDKDVKLIVTSQPTIQPAKSVNANKGKGKGQWKAKSKFKAGGNVGITIAATK
ncbi:hypothetical protein GGF37_000604 [Kickxella alabastrina]|nr:hypothetical protein GGF37_000604 [Kickxella alabastrina]